MSKLFLMGKNALKCGVPRLNPPRFLPSLRRFSSETAQDDSFSQIDPFLQSPQGPVFARVGFFTRNLLKTDIINFFEGCDLSPADVKVEYNNAFNPTGMLLQLPSQSAFDFALKQTVRKGRIYNLTKSDRYRWDLCPSYDGKSILLQGIPRNVLAEDVERFLSGCNFEPNFRIQQRFTIVQFPTATDAMSAYLMKNKGFCLNCPIFMQILH